LADSRAALVALAAAAAACGPVSATSVIDEAQCQTLLQVAQVLKDSPGLQVRDHLVAQGVNSKQLSAEGFGPRRPIASNATRVGRTLNRRVEFRIVGPK